MRTISEREHAVAVSEAEKRGARYAARVIEGGDSTLLPVGLELDVVDTLTITRDRIARLNARKKTVRAS